jgi:hypothetical protein
LQQIYDLERELLELEQTLLQQNITGWKPTALSFATIEEEYIDRITGLQAFVKACQFSIRERQSLFPKQQKHCKEKETDDPVEPATPTTNNASLMKHCYELERNVLEIEKTLL